MGCGASNPAPPPGSATITDPGEAEAEVKAASEVEAAAKAKVEAAAEAVAAAEAEAAAEAVTRGKVEATAKVEAAAKVEPFIVRGHRLPALPLSKRGIRMRELKGFATEATTKLGREATTLMVVLRFIKPRTALPYACRYLDMLRATGEADAVGDPVAFVSHCWGGSFWDLVAALAYAFTDEDYVWLDIFSVLQHSDTPELAEEQRQDLNFVPVVQACGRLVLVAAHLPSVEALDVHEAVSRRGVIPLQDRLRCAFYRVWCLVELAAAKAKEIPVVMLVGEANREGNFQKRQGMLRNMCYLVDVSEAGATVESDRKLILENMMPEIVGLPRNEAIAQINELAKGACNGATAMMADFVPREALQAAVGNVEPLLAMDGEGDVFNVMLASAASGLMRPIEAVFESREVNQRRKNLALGQATQGGHITCVQYLLSAGAEVNGTSADGETSLHMAALSESERLTRLLLAAKADVDAVAKTGSTPLLIATQRSATGVVLALLEANANVNYAQPNGTTALIFAANVGDEGAVATLLKAGADPNAQMQQGTTAKKVALDQGYAAVAKLLEQAEQAASAPAVGTSLEAAARCH